MNTCFPNTGFSPMNWNSCGPNCSPFCVPGTDCSWNFPYASNFSQPFNQSWNWNAPQPFGWNIPTSNWNTPYGFNQPWNQTWNSFPGSFNGFGGFNSWNTFGSMPFSQSPMPSTPFSFNGISPFSFGGFSTPWNWNSPFAMSPWMGFSPYFYGFGFNGMNAGAPATKGSKKNETEGAVNAPFGGVYPFPFGYAGFAPFGLMNPACAPSDNSRNAA